MIEPASPGPKNAVVVLLDSLNRHMLGCYGGTEFATPNIDRFAATHATRFDNHVTGSLPCMPARHDILCGSLDFLWRPWGSIELWEDPITVQLKKQAITTMLISDHPHLFECGGENYHTDFSAWDYVRGHESDPWRTYPDPTYIGAPALPARWKGKGAPGEPTVPPAEYDIARTYFKSEEDYPGPKTMMFAEEWIRGAADHHDRWFLFVDEFDPHEPFDTPAPWAGMYEDEPWDGDQLIWPPYLNGGVSAGKMTEREARHIRANYGAKLSMIDHWFGRILQAFDDKELWDNTALIVCTDHGHYLGEVRNDKDIWGKPLVPQYEPIGHTPLLISWPGQAGGGTCDALTTNVDLNATIADIFDAKADHQTHGYSLGPLLTAETDAIRSYALGGMYGNWVQITDGKTKYARASVGDGFPLSMWSNRWSTLRNRFTPDLVRPDRRATLDYMPGSDVPVIRQPFEAGDTLPYWAGTQFIIGRHHLYNLQDDPDEQENRMGEPAEAAMVDMLSEALRDIDAPLEQAARLGIS